MFITYSLDNIFLLATVATDVGKLPSYDITINVRVEKSYSSSFLVEGNVYALKVFTWRYTPGNFLYLVYRTITRGRDQTPNWREPIASSSNFERNSKWTEFYLARLQKDTLLIFIL